MNPSSITTTLCSIYAGSVAKVYVFLNLYSASTTGPQCFMKTFPDDLLIICSYFLILEMLLTSFWPLMLDPMDS
jgi:hypothetical protein